MTDNMVFRKLSYGLFVLTTKEKDFDNGCIINTAVQISDSPKLISIAVNKENKTNEMIKTSGRFCLSVIDESAEFGLFRRFGFASGRNVNKFENFEDYKKTESGLNYITKGTNAYIDCETIWSVDAATHTVFFAKVIGGEILSDRASATYAYYFDKIKPNGPVIAEAQETKEEKPAEEPKKQENGKRKIKGYVCRICGYFYEGETLPQDFVCPWCKHGAEDFDPVYY